MQPIVKVGIRQHIARRRPLKYRLPIPGLDLLDIAIHMDQSLQGNAEHRKTYLG